MGACDCDCYNDLMGKFDIDGRYISKTKSVNQKSRGDTVMDFDLRAKAIVTAYIKEQEGTPDFEVFTV